MINSGVRMMTNSGVRMTNSGIRMTNSGVRKND